MTENGMVEERDGDEFVKVLVVGANATTTLNKTSCGSFPGGLVVMDVVAASTGTLVLPTVLLASVSLISVVMIILFVVVEVAFSVLPLL